MQRPVQAPRARVGGAPGRRSGTPGAAVRPAQRRVFARAATLTAPARVQSSNSPRQGARGSLALLETEREMCNLISKYSPEYVRSRVLKTPADALLVLARVTQIVVGLGSYAGALMWDQVTGSRDTPDVVRVRAQQLRELLTELGPSFIKAGQVLANRPDIIREDYMNELCILQDDVPPFPDETAFAIIEEQLGAPLEALFSSISERPVAAASLGQVYKAVLREGGQEVAVKVQRPGVEPLILRDLFIFRALGSLFNTLSQQRLGCNAELVVDEFGEKLLEELDYRQEARNIDEFGRNFAGDAAVKIPWVRQDLCGSKVVVMEWIDGIRCTDIPGILTSGIDVDNFIKVGVVSGLRQLLEFGLFHGDPHPGNIFALRDGRIAYVDFGNVAQLSNTNKQILIDAVVHAVNEDYQSMAGDFIKLGFLSPGTDTRPIVPALEKIWRDSRGQKLGDFNFRTVTSKFNELVYQYPIRIPERYSLVIRSLLTQEGICMSIKPEFQFLEVAYPYVARRLLTDEDPALRERLIQVLFQDGRFQWERLTNLISLAREGVTPAAAAAAAAAASSGAPSARRAAGPGLASRAAAAAAASSSSPSSLSSSGRGGGGGLDLSDTVKDALRLLLLDDKLRRQMVMALTEDNRLHVEEVRQVLALLGPDVDPQRLVGQVVRDLPSLGRQVMLGWADRVLVS